MSLGSQFALVFAKEGKKLKFPNSGQPAVASKETKSSAKGFLDTVPFQDVGDIRTALLEALKFAASSSAKRKTIIYIGSGDIYCGGAACTHEAVANSLANSILQTVTSRNSGKVTINTIGVGVKPVRESFLRQLAAKNGGTYSRVDQ